MVQKGYILNMSVEQEILGLRTTLELLGEEKNNLNKHIEIQIKQKLSAVKTLLECVEQEDDLVIQLKIQEENYSAALTEYMEKINQSLNSKDQKIEELQRDNSLLKQSQGASQSHDT